MMLQKCIFLYILILKLCDVYCDEKSSLTFVIDVTESMKNDINHIITGLNHVFDAVIKLEKSQIEDFVIITFEDTDSLAEDYYPDKFAVNDVKLRTKTKDSREFKKALFEIKINDRNSYCPEYSMSGIMKALEDSLPRSYIYVFTDATAKDYKKYEEVKTLALEKQSTVNFVLVQDETRFCSYRKSSNEYTVYQDLAYATAGTIFNISKIDMSHVMTDIVKSVEVRRIVLYNKMVQDVCQFNFDFDCKYKDPVLTITGISPTLHVVGPDGRNANIDTMVNTAYVLIVMIVDAKPGVYTATVGCKYETHVKVTAERSIISSISSVPIDTNRKSAPPIINDSSARNKIKVLHGQNIHILCNITGGTPPPNMTWQVMQKDDTTYKDLSATGQEIHIDSATFTDTGLYRCIAKNGHGQAEKITDVIVERAPEVSYYGTTPVTVAYRSDKEIECQIEGYPLPKVVWKDSKGHKLDSQYTPINFYKMVSKLKLQNITVDDTYSCSATNSLGDVVTTVQVLLSPAIDFPKHNQAPIKVKYEESTDIRCDAMSSYSLKIKWFYQKNKESEKIEIHTSNMYTISLDERTLHIISTDLALVGNYTCEASLLSDENEKASFTTKVEIYNLQAPKLALNESLTIMNGQNMTVNCNAIGIPKPNVTWQYKSVNSDIFDSNNILNIGEQLNYPRISYEQAGSYKCIAQNEVGTNSGTIEVLVKGKPNITNFDTDYYTGVIGDWVLKIPCDVTGVPEPTVTWKHEGKVVTSDDKVTVHKNSIFIKNPTDTDQKNYICEAINEFGSANKSFLAVISDFIDPDEIENNGNIYLKRNASLDIKCAIPVGTDPGSVRWYVNGVYMKYIGITYSLKYVDFINDGNYTCRLNTDQGSASLNYVVDVGFEPSFSTTPALDLKWESNTETDLDCNVRAKPGVTVIKWFRDGTQLNSNDTQLSTFDWGTFTCNVSNPLGSVQRTFVITFVGCFINRTVDRVQNTPLLLDDDTLNWPLFDTQYREFITFSQKEVITLQCSTQDQYTNTFITHPTTGRIEAECLNEDKFIVDGKTYRYENLECKDLVRSSQMDTKNPCMKNGEIIEFGFRLTDRYLGVYEVCYSKAYNKTLYTKVLMSDINKGTIVRSSFKLEPKTTSNEISKCQYNKRWLVSPVDVMFGPAQAATLSDKYNAVSVYEPCESSKRLSWSAIEEGVRGNDLSNQMTVWTGASNYSTKGIPRYLWKVVKFNEGTTEMIVYVNAPNPDRSDIMCPGTTLKNLLNIITAQDHYTYSCSMEDFSKAFNVSLSEFGS